MAHIDLPANAPGIIGPMLKYPDTAIHLNALAESLLNVETPTFTKAQRELLASYVSYLNHCIFCSESHGAAADYHFKSPGMSRNVWQDENRADEAMKSLFEIAKKVQKDARLVAKEDFENAKKYHFTESDLHDAVLISAAFCMFNRYVDGLGTSAPPREDKSYIDLGTKLATQGYKQNIG